MGMFSFQDLGLRQEQRLELGKLLSNKWGAWHSRWWGTGQNHSLFNSKFSGLVLIIQCSNNQYQDQENDDSKIGSKSNSDAVQVLLHRPTERNLSRILARSGLWWTAQSLSVCQVCGSEELDRWLEARSVRSSQREVKEAGPVYPDGGEGSSEYESSNSDANGG